MSSMLIGFTRKYSMRQLKPKLKSSNCGMRPKNSLPESKRTPEIDKKERRPACYSSPACYGIGVFGPGIAMSSGGCDGITEIFGSCQRTSENAENIDRLDNSFNSLNDYVLEIGTQTDEKFFLVADELAKVYKDQNETQENRNRNWKRVEEQFAIVDHNLNATTTCLEIRATQQ